MKLPSLLFSALILLICLFFVPNALTQSDEKPYPPGGFTVEVYRVEAYNPDDISFQSWYNITFKLSDQDPDQVDGDFNYTLWLNSSAGSLRGPVTTSFSFPDIGNTGRSAWKWWLLDTSGSSGTDSIFTFNLTAGNTTSGFESLWSCSVTLDLRINGSFAQCGEFIYPPSGVGLIGTRTAQTASLPEGPVSIPALTDVRWHLSPNDSNQTHGDFEYWISQGASPETMSNYTGATPQYYIDGVQNFTIETFASAPNQRFPFYAKILARDPLTHQRSEFSCTAYVSGGSLRDSGACGDYPVDLSNLSVTGAHFPFLNLTQTAEHMGTTESFIAPILGTFLIFGLATMGLVAGREGGGLVIGGSAALAGAAFAATMGLFPVWLIILLFMGSVSLIVLHFTSNKGGASS